MTNIHKLIYHIVNGVFPLNEAYSTGEMKKLIQHFKDEAEDFEYEIDDDRLEAYINRFDDIKGGLTQKDIYKYSLPTLIKMLSKDTKTKEKVEKAEDEKIEPVEDELYQSEDGKIILVYGMNLKDGEPGCVRLKKSDERWCVTKSGNSMWKSYRRSDNLGYPSFYLAYNLNLPKSDELSAVALQARQNDRFAYTDRTNSPGMSNSMSFDQLLQRIPWLSEIPNLRSMLKWVPLSKAEKQAMAGTDKIYLSDWKNLPYAKKIDYLESRGEEFSRYSSVFRDLDKEKFLKKVLPKYPEVLKHLIDLSVNPEQRVFSPTDLLQGYEYYPEAQQKSLLRHIGKDSNKVPIQYLTNEDIPFELKQDITKDDAWDTGDDDIHIFAVPNKDILAKVNSNRGNAEISLITPEEVFRSRSINNKNIKYVIADPDFIRLPFNIMSDAITAGHLTGKDAKKVIGKYLNAPNTSLLSQKVDGKTIVFDQKSLTGFELDGDNVKRIEDAAELINKVATTDKQKADLQDSFFDGLTSKDRWETQDLPRHLNRDTTISIINSMPYARRTKNGYVMFATNEPTGREPFIWITKPDDNDVKCYPDSSWGQGNYRDQWWDRDSSNPNRSYKESGWNQLFDYWRTKGTGITKEQLLSIMRDGEGYDSATASKYFFAEMNPPLAANNPLKPVVVQGTLWLLNRQNPSECYSVSPSRGKLTQKAVSASKIRQILGEPEAAAPQAEPAQGEQPAAQAAAGEAPAVQQAVAQGDVANVVADLAAAGMNVNALPNSVRNRIVQGGVRLATTDERGARTRNQLLGNRGRVTAIYKLNGTASAVYMITLASGTQIASIAMQPGNYQGILAGGTYYNMTSASDLATTLQARNLNEIMNKENVKKIIREIIKQKIAENNPAPAKPKENPGPAVAPGKPGEKPGPRRPFIKPDTKPEPKAAFNKMNENEKAIVQKIAARFKNKK